MRCVVIALVALAPALLAGASGQGGDEKPSRWRGFLSPEAYKELTDRSIVSIESSAKSGGKDAVHRIQVEAAILAGYTMSVKNTSDKDVLSLRAAALEAAQAASQNDVTRLVDFRKTIQAAPASGSAKRWKPLLPDVTDLMEIFRGKAKRGEGIHADLQYHPKLKNTNGIEALLGALSAKKLSDENLAKVAKELHNLAYRIAVVGSITSALTPKKDVETWDKLSRDMRDSAIALADAAHKKNGDDVLRAAKTLESSCIDCHAAFKNK